MKNFEKYEVQLNAIGLNFAFVNGNVVACESTPCTDNCLFHDGNGLTACMLHRAQWLTEEVKQETQAEIIQELSKLLTKKSIHLDCEEHKSCISCPITKANGGEIVECLRAKYRILELGAKAYVRECMKTVGDE